MAGTVHMLVLILQSDKGVSVPASTCTLSLCHHRPCFSKAISSALFCFFSELCFANSASLRRVGAVGCTCCEYPGPPEAPPDCNDCWRLSLDALEADIPMFDVPGNVPRRVAPMFELTRVGWWDPRTGGSAAKSRSLSSSSSGSSSSIG